MIGLEHHSVGNGIVACVLCFLCRLRCVLCVGCVVCCVLCVVCRLRWREWIMPHRAMEDSYSFDSVDASIYDIWRQHKRRRRSTALTLTISSLASASRSHPPRSSAQPLIYGRVALIGSRSSSNDTSSSILRRHLHFLGHRHNIKCASVDGSKCSSERQQVSRKASNATISLSYIAIQSTTSQAQLRLAAFLLPTCAL